MGAAAVNIQLLLASQQQNFSNHPYLTLAALLLAGVCIFILYKIDR